MAITAPSSIHFSERSSSQGSDSMWAFLCFILAVSFAVITLFLDATFDGRWAFVTAMLMALAIDGSLWFAVLKNDHRCFALKFAFVGFILLKVFPVGACFSLGLSEGRHLPAAILDSPLRAALGGDLRNLAIAFLFLISRPISRLRAFDIPLRSLLKRTSARYEFFLILAALINILYWLAITAPGNPIFYFIRILEKTLNVFPFFVGLTALRFKKALYVWLFVFGVQLVISFLTGTRGAAFVPIIFFLVGFFIGLPTWSAKLRWSAAVLLPLCILLAGLASYIGVVRDVSGRTDLKGVLTEGTMMSRVKDSYIQNQISARSNLAFETFRRLTLWPDYVVPAMTPDPVPYRGFDDILYEARSAFGLGIFAMLDPNWRGDYYFANIFLKQYGFAVHVDGYGKRVSNVELPITIDGFMRGGWWAAFAYAFVGASTVFVVERLLRSSLLPRRLPLFLLMMMFLSYIAYTRFKGAGLVDTMRQLVLEGGFFFACFFTLDFATRRFIRRMPLE